MGQYTLPFDQATSFSEENFFVSLCNTHAFEQIKQWPGWQFLILTGPSGSGKTHLGHIWANRANAMIIRGDSEQLTPENVTSHLFIDNIECVDETALFHVINLCKEHNYSLLLSATKPVKRLGISLPDLSSRLLAMHAATIDSPDDQLLAGVIRKQFADKQIGANEDVIQYMLNHSDRSFPAIAALVDAIDKAMWEQKKNLTIPFVRTVLDKQEN